MTIFRRIYVYIHEVFRFFSLATFGDLKCSIFQSLAAAIFGPVNLWLQKPKLFLLSLIFIAQARGVSGDSFMWRKI